ncbi:MAG: DNRLRE domain-containing protein [Candidatus Margulisbacteria bacterium]|nr:DNRLRE domain-containing protein [Candidatus Margulisiibacteriota bacterium]
MKKAFVLLFLAVVCLGMAQAAETYKVTADTWVYQFRPDKNYGDGYGWKDITDPTKATSSPRIFIGFGGEDKKVGLFQFDTATLKKDKPIKSAYILLYNDQAGSAAPIKVDAVLVTKSWKEGEVTYKKIPKADVTLSTTTLQGAIGLRQPGKWYKFDVTKAVQAWQGGKPNYGIMLLPQGDSGVDFQFICKEAKGHGGHYPRLEVNYK